ncbi:hypothetical protein JCM9140_813 [Halalkalibacter wakoensis JCM 9140]|uniref:Hsp20/alpha crystallin family protein n=1 Tax=Halalkalibacter wakoensis JCM 9140 TaxID=1236970 RepID=W4Q0E5_9BACI|nr:hypothetical protein [Halalkalibacter wakoensis]GAE24854.1 hypothetical protein JCM9140_813 [Halalkalibacter wakoensis JCM 9140]
MNWDKFNPLNNFLPNMDNKNSVVSGIDDYVQNMLSQYLGNMTNPNEQQEQREEPANQEVVGSQPNSNRSKPNPTLSLVTIEPNVIEIHGFIIIQLEIPDYEDINHVTIEYNTTKVIISGFHQHDSITIKLPSLVRNKAGKALYKDGILEISLAKQEEEFMNQLSIKRK